MTAPPLARTALDAVAARHGATFDHQDGWRIARYDRPLEELQAAARTGVALMDAGAAGRIVVEGPGAAAGVAAAFPALPPVPVGRWAALGTTVVCRLRDDRFLVSTDPDAVHATTARLVAATGDAAAPALVVDVTHGQSEIRLLGPAARELLSKLCGLPLDDACFPDGGVAETSVAKIHQLVVRREEDGVPGYALLGARSYAQYLWEALVEAGAEWGVAPVGFTERRVVTRPRP